MKWLLDRLTLRGLYGVLFAALVAVVAAWLFSEADWIETWAPNVGAELAGALVTVAAVDLIVTRRRRPLRDAAQRALDAAMLDLLDFAISQRAQVSRQVDQSEDVAAVLSAWNENLKAGEFPSRAWLKAWSRILSRAENRLSLVRDRYESVLSERMLAALDELTFWSVQGVKRLLWAISLDNASDPEYPSSLSAPEVMEHFDEAMSHMSTIAVQYRADFNTHIPIPAWVWDEARSLVDDANAGLPLPQPG